MRRSALLTVLLSRAPGRRLGLTPSVTTWEEVRDLGIYIPHEMLADGSLIVARFSRIYRSTDEGATVNVISRTPGVIETFSTTIVACRAAGNRLTVWCADGAVWNGIIGGAFTQVFTLETAGKYPLVSYGTFVYNHIMFCNEYGSGVADKAYLSEDYGQTWRKVFTTPARVDMAANHHLHNVAYDPYQDILWITYGDGGNRGTSYSTDMGDTWTHLGAQGAQSVVLIQIVPLPECILFLTDNSVPGAFAIPRKDSKSYSLNDMSRVWDVLGGSAVGGLPIGVRSVVFYGHDARAYLGFTYFDSHATNRPLGHLYATWDGTTFHKLAESPDAPSGTSPFGMIVLLGRAPNGYLYASFDRGEAGEWLVKILEPVWAS